MKNKVKMNFKSILLMSLFALTLFNISCSNRSRSDKKPAPPAKENAPSLNMTPDPNTLPTPNASPTSDSEFHYPKSASVNLSNTKITRCIKPFVLIEDNNPEILSSYLQENLDCLESATLEQRNLFTFALEGDHAEALKVLLKIPGDSAMFKRFYQYDERKKSIFSIINEDLVTYRSILDLVFLLGMRKESGSKGENLADLAWKISDGSKLVTLLLEDQVFANRKGSTEEEYIKQAAKESMSDFISKYADRTGMPLNKRFKEGTLLEISSAFLNKSNFTLEMYELYLDRGAFLTDQSIDDGIMAKLEFLRARMKEDSQWDKIIKINRFHLKIVQKHPIEWESYVNFTKGINGPLEALILSIYQTDSRDLPKAVDYYFPPLKPAAEWSISEGVYTIKGLPLLLAAKGRFPSKTRALKYFDPEIYVSGFEKGVYPNDCILFTSELGFKQQSFTKEHLDRLVVSGLNPKNCHKEGNKFLDSGTITFHLYLSKLTGVRPNPEVFYRATRDSSDNLQQIKSLFTMLKEYDSLESYKEWLASTNDAWKTLTYLVYTDNNSDDDKKYEKSELLNLLTLLNEFGLNDSYSNWLKKDDQKSIRENICLITASQVGTFDKIEKVYKEINLPPESCYQTALQKLDSTYFMQLLKSDKALATKLLKDFKLGGRICTIDEGAHTYDISVYGIDPKDCWSSLMQIHSDWNQHSYSLQLLTNNWLFYTDIFLMENHPEVLKPYSSDLKTVAEICSFKSQLPKPTIATLLYPLINTPGEVGSVCLKKMVTSRYWLSYFNPVLAFNKSRDFEDKSKRFLRRDLSESEVSLILFSTQADAHLTKEEYEVLNNYSSNIIKIIKYPLYQFFEKRTDSEIQKYASQLFRLIADTYDKKSDKTCLKNLLTNFECDYFYFDRLIYISKIFFPNSEKSFWGMWVNSLELEFKEKKYHTEVLEIIDKILTYMYGQIMDSDSAVLHKDYRFLNLEQFLNPYCRVKRKTLNRFDKSLKAFENLAYKMTETNLSPEMCH